MKRFRIIGLCLVAVFAMTAVAASSASAATRLVLKTSSGNLKAGDPVKGDSSNLIFATSAGNLECSENELTGSVTVNEAVKDKGTITGEKSTGAEGGGACKTTTPLGPALITAEHLPWSLELLSSGKAKVKAKKVAFKSVFPAAGGAICTFEASTVNATFPRLKPKKGQELEGPALVITTTGQLFKLNKKVSNAACPESGKLTGDFALTSSGKAIIPVFVNP
jgi:hypothetical protein